MGVQGSGDTPAFFPGPTCCRPQQTGGLELPYLAARGGADRGCPVPTLTGHPPKVEGARRSLQHLGSICPTIRSQLLPSWLEWIGGQTWRGREGSQGGSLSASQMSGHKLGPVPSLQERLAWKAAASWQPE